VHALESGDRALNSNFRNYPVVMSNLNAIGADDGGTSFMIFINSNTYITMRVVIHLFMHKYAPYTVHIAR